VVVGKGVLTVTFVFPVDGACGGAPSAAVGGIGGEGRRLAGLLPAGVEVKLKWPNDLLIVDGIGGLLCERVHKADLVGWG